MDQDVFSFAKLLLAGTMKVISLLSFIFAGLVFSEGSASELPAEGSASVRARNAWARNTCVRQQGSAFP